ncbi:DoxX family protein [Parashewanella spongiae]|uniref:DoxX family protein n=1 Tax=Parashewanella spongiae TaxID=342950 RepID=A0A3A6U3D1_9GAMM|nr:DoxX family protein [Parashewanella spongiae]MCL1079233.1 DoxX family protein [Parashewanella spongiae]RJY07885.1 DoxX family protein [Parashewanella spongiae]
MLDKHISTELGKLILRVTVAGLMLFHGVAKMMHPQSLEFISSMLTNAGLPTFIAYGVFVGEVVAPLAILAGFHTRLSAIIILINMLFVLGLVHMGEIFSLTSSGGLAVELQLFYLLSAIAIALLGSGKFAYKPD